MQEHPPQPTELPKNIQRSMVEELTGEMVHWEEDLSVLEGYERDLMHLYESLLLYQRIKSTLVPEGSSDFERSLEDSQRRADPGP